MENIDTLAKTVWDYHHLHHKIEKCDIIFVLGSSDTRVAQWGAELFLSGFGDLLVISGGIGKISKNVFKKPEAEMFADVAMEMGVPKDKIVLEAKASNTGENITYTYELLKKQGIHPKSLLLVQKPYMERRTYATFKKQWPEAAKIVVTSPNIAYEDYFTPELPKDLVINIMVGDLQRIKDYPAEGFQIPQAIPADVWQAYEKLVAAGYDKFVFEAEK